MSTQFRLKLGGALRGEAPGIRALVERYAPWLAAESLIDFCEWIREPEEGRPHDSPDPIRVTSHRIRFAHQPNFLPSINVSLQPLLTRELASITKSEPLWFVVDYDLRTNRRYRHALLPSLHSRDGASVLTAMPLHGVMDELMYLDPPGATWWVHRLVAQVSSVTLRDASETLGRSSSDFAELKLRLDRMLELIRLAYNESRSFAESNIFLWQRVIGWSSDNSLVQGHKALLQASAHMRYLYERRNDVHHAAEQALADLAAAGLPVGRSLLNSAQSIPFWLLCECSRRTAVSDIDRGVSLATCPGCRRRTWIRSPKSFERLVESGRILPRVLADNLLDRLAWNFRAGCLYAGAAEHYLYSCIVGSALGISPVPEYISQANSLALPDIVPTAFLRADPSSRSMTASQLFETGRASIIALYLWNGSDAVANAWRKLNGLRVLT